jgi:hypothetical protein
MPYLSLYPPILLHWYEVPSLRTIIDPDLRGLFLEKLNTSLLPCLGHLLPALSLSALFISSKLFTESISSSKYSGYKAYQKRVAMFGPFMTFIKALKIKLVDGANEEKEVERSVWGNPHSIKKD